MNLLLSLFAQFLRCLVMLCRKDGLSAVIAQNLLLTQQLIILNRGRERAPNIKPLHRILLGFFASFLGASAIKCGNLTRNSAEAQFQSPSSCRIENTASAKQAKERSPGTLDDNLLARLASLVFSFPFRTSMPGEGSENCSSIGLFRAALLTAPFYARGTLSCGSDRTSPVST